MFVPDALLNTEAWINNLTLYHKLALMFKIAIIGVTVLFSLSNANRTIKFSMWLICSLLVSGYGNSFSMLLLLIPAINLYSDLKDNKFIVITSLLLLLLASNIPFHYFSTLAIPLRFPRLYALLGLFTIISIAYKTKIKWWYFAMPLIVILIPFTPKAYAQNYFINKEAPFLIYDFSFSNKALSLNYFDNAGPQTKVVELTFNATKINYTSGTLTKKSCVINDSIMVYLSDENRGVGFYTLRKAIISNDR